MTDTPAPVAQPHPAYPDGPDCQTNCPGPWSSYHDGYGDGLAAGDKMRDLLREAVDDAYGSLVYVRDIATHRLAAIDAQLGAVHEEPPICRFCGDMVQRGKPHPQIEHRSSREFFSSERAEEYTR